MSFNSAPFNSLPLNVAPPGERPVTAEMSVGTAWGQSIASGVGTLTVDAQAVDNPIKYIDLDGIDDPKTFWDQVVRPDLEDFRGHPTARRAFHVAWGLWSLTDWIWFERHRAENNRGACALT